MPGFKERQCIYCKCFASKLGNIDGFNALVVSNDFLDGNEPFHFHLFPFLVDSCDLLVESIRPFNYILPCEAIFKQTIFYIWIRKGQT